MATARTRDWTELPHELLGMIAERLSIVDYISFGCVCNSWDSVVSGGRFYRPNPQSPWLILSGKVKVREEGKDNKDVVVRLYDNKSNWSYRPPPELRGKWFVGSTEGWIVTIDEVSEMRLLNPLTREQLGLPSITTFPGIQVTRNSEGDVTEFLHRLFPYTPPHSFSPSKFRQKYISKVILSSCPATSGYIAMAIFSCMKTLAFAKVGDDKWTVLTNFHRDIEDVIYHNGKFYSFSFESELQAWDISGFSPKMTTIFEAVEDDANYLFKKYLVESSGELLYVSRQLEYGELHDVNTITKVRVFKCDPIGGKWIPVNNLGDRCLFLGLNHSMSFSPQDIPGLMLNCIYFADNHDDYGTLPCILGMFNLEDRSFKSYNPFDFLEYIPTPIWLVPNPLKIQ